MHGMEHINFYEIRHKHVIQNFTLKIESAYFTETSVSYQTTRYDNPDGHSDKVSTLA